MDFFTKTPNLPELPSVSQISPRVWRILGQNPGSFTLQGTNTYLVGTGPSRALIDTGQGKAGYINCLKEAMTKSGCQEISHIFITHYHFDHTGGVESIRSLFPNVVIHFDKAVYPKLLPNTREIENKQVWEVEGATLEALRTPGHTADHYAFILQEENAVFTGDCVLGSPSTSVSDLVEYLSSLRLLISVKPDRIYPGHGEMVEDAKTHLSNYLNHRNKRVIQIQEVLQTQPADSRGVTPSEITSVVYGNLPRELRVAARNNVKQGLEVLKKEGKAQRKSASSWLGGEALWVKQE